MINIIVALKTCGRSSVEAAVSRRARDYSPLQARFPFRATASWKTLASRLLKRVSLESDQVGARCVLAAVVSSDASTTQCICVFLVLFGWPAFGQRLFPSIILDSFQEFFGAAVCTVQLFIGFLQGQEVVCGIVCQWPTCSWMTRVDWLPVNVAT